MKTSKAAVIGGAAMAGAAVLGAGAITAIVSNVVRRRATGKSRRQLSGKIVLITGASRGLGLAMAEEFGRFGAKLILTARDLQELNRARSLLVEKGAAEADRILIVPADLRNAEEAQHLIQHATEYFGRIDVLVNNAGVITAGPVENQTIHDFHDVMNANFFSGIHCSTFVLPQMLERRNGTIVNIASIGGKVAVPHLLPYTASKFAVVGFSQGLDAELRSKGIHVLTVCPGLMRTGSHLNALFSGDAPREYSWFSLLANLPGLSATAQSAARKIVQAILSGETEIAITPQAILISRLSQTVPELTSLIMCLTNLLLPRAVRNGAGAQRGAEVRDLELMPASTIGMSAARRYNQLD